MTIELTAFGGDCVIPTQAAFDTHPAAALGPHQPGARQGFYAGAGKRLVDLVLTVGVLAVVIIPMAVIALALRLSLGPNVIYRQARIGLDGRVFTVLKFRTMRPDRRAVAVGRLPDGSIDRRLQHKTVHDPRHTGIGRFLRKTSLDELPQLFNVLRGDMSVVGPRPELVHLVEKMSEEQKGRHGVRPGLTGAWQVTARGKMTLHEATDLDLDYISNLSFRRDLVILLRTPAALLGRTGS